MRLPALASASSAADRLRHGSALHRGALVVGFGLLIVSYPWIAPSSYWVRVACWVGLYALLASGLNVVVGLAGLLDLGYVAFYGIGSYAFALLASNQFDIHWSFWAIAIIALATTALAGILLGVPVLRLR